MGARIKKICRRGGEQAQKKAAHKDKKGPRNGEKGSKKAPSW